MIGKMKVLIVDPHAGIWPHSRTSFQISRALLEMGHRVKYLGCGKGMLDRCHVNESVNRALVFNDLNPDCKKCSSTEGLIFNSLGRSENFDSTTIEALLINNDEILKVEMNRLLQLVRKGKPLSSANSYVPVSDLAMYETHLRFKLRDLSDLTKIQRSYHLAFTLNALRASHASIRLSREFNPDIVFAYSPQYSAVGASAWVFEKNGIPVIFVEGSASLYERHTHLRMWNWGEFGLNNPRLEDYQFTTLSETEKSRVEKHFDVIKKGSHYSVYSPKMRVINFKEHFNLLEFDKIALLAMSSSDEIGAAQSINRLPKRARESNVFATQLEWLRFTMEWFRENPKLACVVRPHPRDFSTRREPHEAQHVSDLQAVLRDKPDNVVVDDPKVALPLWAYFAEIQVLITGWSGSALEAIYNQVPVLTYDEKLLPYPTSLVTTGLTLEDYQNNLGAIMQSDRNSYSSRKEEMFSWLNHSFSHEIVRIHGRFFEFFRIRSTYFNKMLSAYERFMPKTYRYLDTFSLRRKDNLKTQVDLARIIDKNSKIACSES